MKKKMLIPIVVCIILLAVSIGGNLWLWTSLDEANSEITSLETTVYTKSSEIENLEATINTKNSEIENLEQEVNSLGLEKEALEAQTSDLEATINTKKSEIETLESQVAGLQADKSSLQSQVSFLETENNQLQTWLDGNITIYESHLTAKDAQILDLEDENDELWLTVWSLTLQYDTLNTSYTWLEQHSFTYYTVGNAINISNVGIFKEWLFGWTINGTITNISNKPIETVYVYLILRNPDGTTDFDTWDYVEIGNLYIDETAPFEFPYSSYDESQTVEIFLVY